MKIEHYKTKNGAGLAFCMNWKPLGLIVIIGPWEWEVSRK